MAKRRSKGDGSLTQRSSDGRWQGSLVVELPNGSPKRRYFYGRTKAEAKAKLDQALRDQADGSLVATTPTLERAIADWLERRKLPPKPLKASTWNGYESKIRVHVVPRLGPRRLGDLEKKPHLIEDAYDAMRAGGAAEANVRQVHAILSKFFKDMTRGGKVGRNPMERVQPPGTETSEREQFTDVQAVHALRAAGDSARWWLALFYGLRRGEALGLDWRYVDWQGHTLSIAETLTEEYGSRAFTAKGTPKSRASRRTLPMLPQIEVRLRLLWEDQGQPEAGPVFRTSRGTPVDPRNDYRAWRAFIADAGLPPIALHAARNSAASLMEAAGVPDRVVAEILGHAQVRITHGYQRAAVERMRQELARVGLVVEPAESARALPAPGSPPA